MNPLQVFDIICRTEIPFYWLVIIVLGVIDICLDVFLKVACVFIKIKKQKE